MSTYPQTEGALIAAPRFVTAWDHYIATGKYPVLGDPTPPWEFKGWLLPKLIEAEQAFYFDSPGLSENLTAYMQKKHKNKGIQIHANRPGIGRWEYYLRMIGQDALVDEPIPALHISDNVHDGSPGLKHVQNLILQIEELWGYGAGLPEFIRWLAFACGVAYSETSALPANVQEMLYRTFDGVLWLNEPADYLGTLLAERKGSGKWNNPHAFFPTPSSVTELMARMTFNEAGPGQPWVDERHLTVCDPCVGTGRMLLSAGARSLRLYACDIDMSCVLSTLINGAFFCPWLAFGAPERWFEKPAPTVADLARIAVDHHPPESDLIFVNANNQGLLFGEAPETLKKRRRK